MKATSSYGDFKPLKKVYLASPFTYKKGKIPVLKQFIKFVVELYRFLYVSYKAGILESEYRDIAFFLPITSSYVTHQLVQRLGGEFSNWAAVDLTWISSVDEVWVLQMDGWDASVGVLAEIDYAVHNSIPIKFLSTDLVVTGVINRQTAQGCIL